MIQLVKLTQTWFVHKLIGVLGTTVRIPFVTTAVPIVAHHVPYVNVTNVQSIFHVQLTHGYCVLSVVHDAGVVIVCIQLYHKRTRWFLVSQLNKSKYHHTIIVPSDCKSFATTRVPFPVENNHVNVASTNHVEVTLTSLFLVISLNHVNFHQIIILPSGWGMILKTILFAKVQVKVSSTTQVDVKRANLPFVIQLNVEKFHHTITLPSGCTYI